MRSKQADSNSNGGTQKLQLHCSILGLSFSSESQKGRYQKDPEESIAAVGKKKQTKTPKNKKKP